MGRRYAVSDIHGCLQPFKELMESLEPDDVLFFLGDAIDRGEDGVEIMETLLEDKRVVYLQGNHEEFMLKSIPDLLKGRYNSAGLWLDYNGGNKTWDKLKTLPQEKILWFMDQIERMPTYIKYVNENGITVHLSHAGFSPSEPEGSRDYLWDRKHISVLDTPPEKEVIIHGHTPVQLLLDFCNDDEADRIIALQAGNLNQAIWYCENTKLDIDLCTIVSNKLARVDLDTFEIRYFGSGRQQSL